MAPRRMAPWKSQFVNVLLRRSARDRSVPRKEQRSNVLARRSESASDEESNEHDRKSFQQRFERRRSESMKATSISSERPTKRPAKVSREIETFSVRVRNNDGPRSSSSYCG